MALDYDSQELIGKLHFKHEIIKMEIKGAYIFISFLHKIIVCDVFKLKHLIKQETGDEAAIFDAHVINKEDRDEIMIASVDEKSKKVIISQCNKIEFLLIIDIVLKSEGS